MEAELYTLTSVALASDLTVSAIAGILYELSDNTNAQFIRPFDWGVHTFTEKMTFVKPPKARGKCDFVVSSVWLLSNTACG